MKVSFKVPKASVAVASIRMENQNFYVREILSLCDAASISTDDTSAIFTLNIPKLVQGAGYGADINSQTAATSFIVLSNDKFETFQNLQRQTVNKFIKGVTYLIDGVNQAPVNITPDFLAVPVGGTGTIANTIIAASHFRFDCAESVDVLNATHVSGCISVEYDIKQIAQRAKQRADSKAVEVANFASNIK